MSWTAETRWRRAKVLLGFAWMTSTWGVRLVDGITSDQHLYASEYEVRALAETLQSMGGLLRLVSLFALALAGLALARRERTALVGRVATGLALAATAVTLLLFTAAAIIDEPGELIRTLFTLAWIVRDNLGALAMGLCGVALVRESSSPRTRVLLLAVVALAWAPALMAVPGTLLGWLVTSNLLYQLVDWVTLALALISPAGLLIALRARPADPPAEPPTWRTALRGLDGLVLWALLRIAVLSYVAYHFAILSASRQTQASPVELVAGYWLAVAFALPMAFGLARTLAAPAEAKARGAAIAALVFFALRGVVDLFMLFALSTDLAAGRLSGSDIEGVYVAWGVQAILALLGLLGVVVLATRWRRAVGAETSPALWLSYIGRWLSLVGIGGLAFSLSASRLVGAVLLLLFVALMVGADLFFLSRLASSRRAIEEALEQKAGAPPGG